MSLVPAICTRCGAQIEVDDSQEAGICERCGTAFITERVVNSYMVSVIENTQQETNNIQQETKGMDQGCVKLLNAAMGFETIGVVLQIKGASI